MSVLFEFLSRSVPQIPFSTANIKSFELNILKGLNTLSNSDHLFFYSPFNVIHSLFYQLIGINTITHSKIIPYVYALMSITEIETERRMIINVETNMPHFKHNTTTSLFNLVHHNIAELFSPFI
ncbi:hypothetical protein HZS_6103 [Henneguya salminicola]|nr:hypothetical protein HZS_6103 [Henneguya salminicola]